MKKVTNFVKKYQSELFVGVTTLNTLWFVLACIAVLKPGAPAAAAVWCVFTGFVAFSGWFLVSYEYSMKKIKTNFKERL